MFLPNGNFIGNRAGILFVNASLDSASSSTTPVFDLPNHTFRYLSGLGIFVCDFDTAVTGATSVSLAINNTEVPLTDAADEALTALTKGLHLLVFNKYGNKLQVII